MQSPDTPHKERIAGDEFAVVDEDTDRVQVVPRCKQGLDTNLAELHLVPMVELDVRFDSGIFISRKLDVAGVKDVIASYMVMMCMRVKNIGDFEPECFHPGCQFGGVVAWIDHCAQPTLFIPNEIAKIAIPSSLDLLQKSLFFPL